MRDTGKEDSGGYRKEAGNEGCRKRGKKERRDAGKEGCRIGGIQSVGFRADEMRNKRDSRKEGSQERKDAGKERCRKY